MNKLFKKKKAKVQGSTVKNCLEHHANQVTMTLESERTTISHVCSSTEKRKAA